MFDDDDFMMKIKIVRELTNPISQNQKIVRVATNCWRGRHIPSLWTIKTEASARME